MSRIPVVEGLLTVVIGIRYLTRPGHGRANESFMALGGSSL